MLELLKDKENPARHVKRLPDGRFVAVEEADSGKPDVESVPPVSGHITDEELLKVALELMALLDQGPAAVGSPYESNGHLT